MAKAVSLGSRTAPRPQRLAMSIVSELIDLIVSGSIRAGGVLPAEAQLSTEFGVSRIVGREALKTLEEKGLVTIRQGMGTVVAERPSWNVLDHQVLDALVRHDESLSVVDSLVVIRAALESEMARAAAENGQPGNTRLLFSLTEEMQANIDDPDRFAELDLRFHDAVMDQSANEIGRGIVASIHRHARASAHYHPDNLTDLLTHSHDEHVRIAERIRDKDGRGAFEAMSKHILGSWNTRKATGRLREPD